MCYLFISSIWEKSKTQMLTMCLLHERCIIVAASCMVGGGRGGLLGTTGSGATGVLDLDGVFFICCTCCLCTSCWDIGLLLLESRHQSWMNDAQKSSKLDKKKGNMLALVTKLDFNFDFYIKNR